MKWWNSLSEERKEFLQMKYNISVSTGSVAEEVYNKEHDKCMVSYYNCDDDNIHLVNWNDYKEVSKIFLNKRNILFNDKRVMLDQVKQWVKPLHYINFTFNYEEVFWSMETGTVLITRLEMELADLIRKEFNKATMTGLAVHRLKYLQELYSFCKQKMMQNEITDLYSDYEKEFSNVKERLTDVEAELSDARDTISDLEEEVY